MGTINIILDRDFKEFKKTKSFLVLIILSIILTVAAVTAISVLMCRIEWLMQQPARPMLLMLISLVVYFLPFFIILSFIWAYSSLPVVKEKANGNITNLIATPLNPKKMWIGKSLAIFLPGFIISVISITVFLLVINLVIILGSAIDYVIPVPLLLTGLVVNPLLFFGLVLLIMLLSLTVNPDIAIAPSFVFGFGLMLGIPLGIATGTIDLASWDFFTWYLVSTTVFLIIVICLSRLLTKENIVLSGSAG